MRFKAVLSWTFDIPSSLPSTKISHWPLHAEMLQTNTIPWLLKPTQSRCSYVGWIGICNCYVFLLIWSLNHYVVSFLISCNLLYFKVYFVWYEDCYSSFPLLPIFMEYIFPSSHFQSVCLEVWSGFLVDRVNTGLVFLSIQPVCVFWLKSQNFNGKLGPEVWVGSIM